MDDSITKQLARVQDPKAKKSSLGFDFTPTIHHDTYEYVSPVQFDLKGRAVLVTGASKGIGRETALSSAKAGASFIALGARSPLDGVVGDVLEAARQAGRPEPKILALKLDVTSKESVHAAAKEIQAAFGRLDIVINNAGYATPVATVSESGEDDWWQTWQVNILGTYLVTKACIPLLLGSSDGLRTIMNVTSIAAYWPIEGQSSYCCSKLAMIRFTEICNFEYGDQGLVCHVIHPGGVETELSQQTLPPEIKVFLTDTPMMGADTIVWMTAERRDWLAGRYISAQWDMEELVEMRERIEKEGLLRCRLDVGLE